MRKVNNLLMILDVCTRLKIDETDLSVKISMKKVLTVGVYDILHIGHVLLFKHARELGDILIVAVQESDVARKYKPSAKLVYTTDERMFMVGSMKFVDQVVSYREVDNIVKTIDFDILAVGPDQNHQGFQMAIKWALEHGKKVVVIPRTEGVSSTILRDYLKNND